MPKLITPRQIDRGIPHLAGPLVPGELRSSGPSARPSRASLIPSSRECRRPFATTQADEAKDPVERRRVAVPVLAHDPLIRRAEDDAERKPRDDRVVQGTHDRYEFGNEVDR